MSSFEVSPLIPSAWPDFSWHFPSNVYISLLSPLPARSLLLGDWLPCEVVFLFFFSICLYFLASTPVKSAKTTLFYSTSSCLLTLLWLLPGEQGSERRCFPEACESYSLPGFLSPFCLLETVISFESLNGHNLYDFILIQYHDCQNIL